MGTEDQRRAIIAEVAAELRDLAEYLRAERARRTEAGRDTELLDRALTELDPLVVLAHEADVAGAIGRVLDRHGPGPWPDADLATVAGVDLTELRRLRDQLAAAGLAHPNGSSPPQHPQQ
ncbi:hypothetical protein [Nocardia sp. NPDC059195]|uniref:hypothetical protein n=1 Tax=Nocardia sp. NPDC059195 TaxID=3346765 RepID=UPI0036C0D0F1